jgi:hypothetical protein
MAGQIQSSETVRNEYGTYVDDNCQRKTEIGPTKRKISITNQKI